MIFCVDDDSAMVFEIINDRGEDLKPFDILKGKLIGALSKEIKCLTFRKKSKIQVFFPI